jgi:hypothetical protein
MSVSSNEGCVCGAHEMSPMNFAQKTVSECIHPMNFARKKISQCMNGKLSLTHLGLMELPLLCEGILELRLDKNHLITAAEYAV